MNSGALVTALTSLGRMSDISLFKRWNVTVFPDHAQRPLKDAMIGHLTSGLAYLTYQEK
jgi:hypothetical protein